MKLLFFALLYFVVFPFIAFADHETNHMGAITPYAQLFGGVGMMGTAVWLVKHILSENKADKERLLQEQAQARASYTKVIEETRQELKESHADMVIKQEEHSGQLVAISEKNTELLTKVNNTIDNFTRVADECSKTRACKADQLKVQGGG